MCLGLVNGVGGLGRVIGMMRGRGIKFCYMMHIEKASQVGGLGGREDVAFCASEERVDERGKILAPKPAVRQKGVFESHSPGLSQGKSSFMQLNMRLETNTPDLPVPIIQMHTLNFLIFIASEKK